MPTFPKIALRILASGALAVGLLATAPVAESHAATRHQASTGKQAPASSSARRVGSALAIAAKQKGDPYRWGAAGPNAFDCSGLTYYSFRKAGFKKMPRTSSQQANFVKRIKRTQMQRGDLMFFFSGGRVYHVGIYAGFKNGHRLVLHAPRTGSRVHTEQVWTNKWFPGTMR